MSPPAQWLSHQSPGLAFPRTAGSQQPCPPGLAWEPLGPDGKGCRDQELASCQGTRLAGRPIREWCLQGGRKWPEPHGKGLQGPRFSPALASRRLASWSERLEGTRVCRGRGHLQRQLRWAEVSEMAVPTRNSASLWVQVCGCHLCLYAQVCCSLGVYWSGHQPHGCPSLSTCQGLINP